MEDYLQIGVITTPHGLKGEVKIFPTTDEPSRFKKLKEAILFTDKSNTLLLHPESVKFFKQFVIVKFKEFHTIEDVEKLRQKPLYVTRKNAIPLRKDEFFIADLIGLKVVTEDGEEFGTLKDVIQTGANDVYVVDSLKHGEVLLPAIKDCIKEIDMENKTVRVFLMPGLIDG